jgi:hypothetical protein
MSIKKIAGWAVVIFLAYYLITKPTGADNVMHNILGGLKTVGSSLATFLNGL